jgi:hypothetical protein
MNRAGVGLLLAAYAIFVVMALAGPLLSGPHPHGDPVMLAEYAAPWPTTLLVVLAGLGSMLAWIPIRRGERWAIWISAAMFLALFVVRFATDPRCLVVLDPHQHGCHTFMISVALGGVGLLLAAKR